MNPLRYRRAVLALVMFSVLEARAQEPLTTRWESAPLTAAFAVFSETGRMPPDLGRFIADAALQKIEPYKAFDNGYYVGICWVSAWLLISPHGHVLIDTLYGPYSDKLLDYIRALGFDPKDIKLVVITHGHFDHAGGAARLKSLLEPQTRFAMSREGWREAAESAAQLAGGPSARTMIEPDLVISDGQVLTAGDVTIEAFATPGHTMGTVSFAYDARDGGRTYRAFTVGGLGLNAIKSPDQVEAFITSVKRIGAMTEDTARPIELHLTTHGFSTGLTEAKDLLKTCKPGDAHPLVDLPAFRRQLDQLQAGAERRLAVERDKKAN